MAETMVCRYCGLGLRLAQRNGAPHLLDRRADSSICPENDFMEHEVRTPEEEIIYSCRSCGATINRFRDHWRDVNGGSTCLGTVTFADPDGRPHQPALPDLSTPDAILGFIDPSKNASSEPTERPI
jgi:hypothetical protein